MSDEQERSEWHDWSDAVPTVSDDGPSRLPRAFSAAEHTARVEAVQQRMAQRELAALIVVDPANLYYLTGYNAWSFYVPQCLVVPAQGPVHLFGRPMDMLGAHYTAHISPDRVHAYPEDLIQRADAHPFEWMTQRAKDLGLLPDRPGTRVAAETDAHYFSPRGYLAVVAGLQHATVVDAHELVNWVRLIKSPAEREMLRAAGLIADSVMQAALFAMAPGRRQCDVVADILAAQAAGTGGDRPVGPAGPVSSDAEGILEQIGGDYPAIMPMLPTGRRAGTPHLTWSEEEFVLGEATCLELAGAYHRYHAPLARTVSLGPPAPQLARCAEIVADGMAAALEAMRPGAEARAAHAAFTSVIARHGMTKEARIGYSIGIGYPPDWGERTVSLRSSEETVLQAGMAFHVILGMWDTDWGYELSESVLISNSGAERLTHQPQELTVIS
ncbi:ectoine hydrolase [Kineosphaera limosa]|uniref:Putative peptidase M24 family protein n=1 Tax=Kineosphaera limosa NBRC 100340 TaxID=1184609 RepID=K6X1E7_9MICO|nr:M24 family metallopeptidase [Kineosphaera limosa]NYE00129.1 ectoine hydrolase [Kineosphaera limosa]GAB98192.1 putative peptidase M24 family protein [Kineosphaera limosa NBRC 100340]